MNRAPRRTRRSGLELFWRRRRLVAATAFRNRWLPFWRSPNWIAQAGIDRPVIHYRAPSIRIECVISPVYQHSQGGLHTSTAAAYKVPGGAPVEERLHLIRPVVPGNEAQDAFPSPSIQRLDVLLSEEWNRAVVRRVLPVGTVDPALLAIRERLAQPLIIESDLLGPLALDRRGEVLQGTADWNGNPVAVVMMGDRSLDDLLEKIDEYLARARDLWGEQATWESRVRDFVAGKFHGEFDAWLEESEHTATDLATQMELQEITFSGLDTVGFYYHDTLDVLGGHAISVTLEDGALELDLPG